MQAKLVQEGNSIDYTPASAVDAGAVVVLGTQLVGITSRAIAANTLGALMTTGVFDVAKVTGAITLGAPLYLDVDGDPVGGTAGSGALSTSSAVGPFAGWAAVAALEADTTVRMLLDSENAATTVVRASLGQDDLAVYALPLESFKPTDSPALLGATAGTPSGAFGITVGTHGTASPKIVGEAASANSKTNKMRRQFCLPVEYVAGQTVTLRVHARITGNVEVAQTIDAEVFEADKEAGIGTDICATAAQSLTDEFADYDFTITPTTLAPGDVLDIELTGVANDTGGTANKLIEIGFVALLLDVKG